jgi:flavin-dependent dehydrogenase
MDAIAAGGGLAGTAFALELARHGAKAMIIERTAGPHHKVCGDFLTDKAKVLLQHLGLDTSKLGGSRIDTLGLADKSSEAKAPLPFEALGLSRYCLDEALLEAATRQGVELLRSTTVEGLEDHGDGVVVRTTHGVHRARVAALASGKHNIRGIARPAGNMVGFKMHLLPSPAAKQALRGLVQLVAFSGGYVGLCLVENDVLSIAWTIRGDVLRETGTSWEAQSAYFAKASSLFGDLTMTASPVWPKPLAIAGLPYGYMRREPVTPNIYPVGDQLAVIPSFAGDGTALALASGIAAAHAVLDGENAHAFQRRLVRGHGPQFRIVKALDAVIATPMLRRVSIAVAQAAPSVVTKLVSATRLRGFAEIAKRPV